MKVKILTATMTAINICLFGGGMLGIPNYQLAAFQAKIQSKIDGGK